MNEKRTHALKMSDLAAGFETREDQSEHPYIEGYFAVYDDIYQLWDGATESIAPGAFDKALSGDIRALINHDTTLVLGRTKSGTVIVRQDSHGLWGHIDINPADSDAMNAHARVVRRDVDQCSIGFEIESEEAEYRSDGTIHWRITSINPLYEITICTFPAYEATSITARQSEYRNIAERQTEMWRSKMKDRLRGGK